MTSNFGRSYLLRLNSDLGGLGLYGKPIESRIHSYAEEDIRCQTEVLNRARLGKVSSSVQVRSSGLTTNDLQLRNVISHSFELRFLCSWTLWRAHCVKNIFICLRRILDIRLRY